MNITIDRMIFQRKLKLTKEIQKPILREQIVKNMYIYIYIYILPNTILSTLPLSLITN